MLDTRKLTLIDSLAFSMEELKQKLEPQEWEAFERWQGRKPHYLSTQGEKCILQNDFQLYIRLRTNTLKKLGKK